MTTSDAMKKRIADIKRVLFAVEIIYHSTNGMPTIEEIAAWLQTKNATIDRAIIAEARQSIQIVLEERKKGTIQAQQRAWKYGNVLGDILYRYADRMHLKEKPPIQLFPKLFGIQNETPMADQQQVKRDLLSETERDIADYIKNPDIRTRPITDSVSCLRVARSGIRTNNKEALRKRELFQRDPMEAERADRIIRTWTALMQTKKIEYLRPSGIKSPRGVLNRRRTPKRPTPH